MSRLFVRLPLIALVLLSLTACASEEPNSLPAPKLETIDSDAGADAPAGEETKRPTEGPLAKLAQAMREAEQETDRARVAQAKVKALTLDREALQAKLAKRTRERDATKKLLAKAKKELRQNMARLIDSEMERVRVEQELLRRKIEVEEKKRVEDQ